MKKPNEGRGARVHPGLAAVAAVLHLGAVCAFWWFTWAGLVAFLVMWVVVGQFGIGLGYHRLLCHRSYQVPGPLRCLLALLGVLAFQGGPLTWCAIHRLHHRHSDSEDDPQMSHHSFWWSHMLWALVDEMVGLSTPADVRRVTADLQREPFLQFLERWQGAVHVAQGLALLLGGWAFGDWGLGVSLLLWGFFLRATVGLHTTFLVNSINHHHGYRNYATDDNSRNCWWVALLTFGEGWHNNHHAQPRSAAHGHRWFEVDTSYALIRLMEWLGLASRVVRPIVYGEATRTRRGERHESVPLPK
jgi:stearoyl-CoA desaturase (delta-9 desaturase)